jgi:hypothetical protein
MATKYWTNGAGTGVVSTASNWSPSGAPAADDVLIFADSTTGSATSDEVVGGDYSSLGDMAEIRIGRGFVKSFGSTVAYVQIEASSVIIDSGASVFLDVECAGASDKVIVNNTPFGSNALRLRGDINELRILQSVGTITIEATTANTTGSGYTEVDTIYMFSVSGAVTIIETNVSSIDNIYLEGGRLLNSAAVVQVDVYSGNYTQLSTGAITTLNTYNNAFVSVEGSGTVTTLTMFEGYVTMQNNGSDGLTVTNCTVHSGVLDLQSSLRNITFTNDIINKGGVLKPPLASTVALTY